MKNVNPMQYLCPNPITITLCIIAAVITAAIMDANGLLAMPHALKRFGGLIIVGSLMVLMAASFIFGINRDRSSRI